jgi:hypothetical protein
MAVVIGTSAITLWRMKAKSGLALMDSFNRSLLTQPTATTMLLVHREQGVEASVHAGVPDFVMATEQGVAPRRITVVLEVKNPWQVIQSISCLPRSC